VTTNDGPPRKSAEIDKIDGAVFYQPDDPPGGRPIALKENGTKTDAVEIQQLLLFCTACRGSFIT